MSFEAPGVTVVSEPPRLPSIEMAPPSTSTAVVPVAGPRGPAGGTGAMAFVYTTSSPAMTHQVQHGLSFKPGGISCIDTDGVSLVGFTVTHPLPGITEVSFGAAVTPTIYLS
jgi:hypothetical protein